MARKPKVKMGPRGWGGTKPYRDGKQVQAEIRVGGRRYRPVFPTQELADRFLDLMREQRVDVAAGAEPNLPALAAEHLRYPKLLQELRSHYKLHPERKLSDATLDGYLSELRRVEAYWGTRLVRETTKADVFDWIQAMQADDLSSSAINHHLDRLSQAHQLALDRGWLEHLPCEIPRRKVVLRSEPDALPELEYERVLAYARTLPKPDGPEALAVLLLAGDAGLRRGEIFRLAWPDLRFDAKPPYVHVRVEGEDLRTKSRKGRDVPMTDRLRDALKALGSKSSGRLFPRAETESGITWTAGRAWRQALGSDATLHRLRHRFGTELGRQGVSVPVIQQLMGHANVATTMRYVHVVPALPAKVLRGARRATDGQRAAGKQKARTGVKP